MAYETKDNTGTLFVNDKKEKPNHPDFKGSALIAGIDYWVSSWKKEGKGGKAFMSFSYTKKEPKAADGESAFDMGTPKKVTTDAPFSDDIPF